ncbi:hypothetical protein BU16DRAFT_555234 [Lophium mytilinum]|uniref:Uncharacterized protein n=1 Tax=Lophium mytilinum TaxID=390894 RepID=A0A6A6RHM1_9PEZI|nr:hypothetical protein BU16DRAFT_555234 [Lophium mytilinum]
MPAGRERAQSDGRLVVACSIAALKRARFVQHTLSANTIGNEVHCSPWAGHVRRSCSMAIRSKVDYLVIFDPQIGRLTRLLHLSSAIVEIVQMPLCHSLQTRDQLPTNPPKSRRVMFIDPGSSLNHAALAEILRYPAKGRPPPAGMVWTRPDEPSNSQPRPRLAPLLPHASIAFIAKHY